MKPTFPEGALLAAIVSVLGGMLYHVLKPVYGSAPVLHVLCALIGLSYVLYLLLRSHVRVGFLTMLAGWAIGATVIACASPSVLLTVCGHLGLVWLTRVFIYHSSVLAALVDLGLTAFSLIAAAWAVTQTQSLIVTLWCLMLVQAMFTWIPSPARAVTAAAYAPVSDHERFERVQRTAEAAIHALSTSRNSTLNRCNKIGENS